MRPSGPTNQILSGLIQELRKKSIEHGVNIWKRIASDLEKPTRKRRIVNLYKINKFTKENETVIVPGKVLAVGDLDHAVTVAAFNFSGAALDKINKVGKAISINELIKESPKGKRIRILC
ncbi:50S ribosomal protein L18e [Candidatus Woesearchaeota archaeon]|nr:50S ribosomal protein L18e [Candidatus Woesearchaeota archaeon]